MDNRLDEARKNINAIDKEMAELFVKRMEASKMVSDYKVAHGLPILDKTREMAVIERNSALISDEVIREYYVDFLSEVMSCSRRYQYRLQAGMNVAYSGVEGAFAHIASKKIFPNATLSSCGDFAKAYEAVVKGECNACVLPIENSFAGEVGQTVDLIHKGELYVSGIYRHEIRHNLLGVKGAKLGDIKKVFSHPQALMQCADFIKENNLITEESNNTALSAKVVAESGDVSIGAIASIETAALYGLDVIEKNVNQSNVNTTRFAVLTKAKLIDEKNTHSVLTFTVNHEAGALAKAINIIGKHGYNMTALRSRPQKNHAWQYYFYVEVDGNVYINGEKMLQELSTVCEELKVAGTFNPNAEI